MSSLEDKIEIYAYQASQPLYYLLETQQDPFPWNPEDYSKILKNHSKQLEAIGQMGKLGVCDFDEYIKYSGVCMDLFSKKLDKFKIYDPPFRVTKKAAKLYRQISQLLPVHETIVHRDTIEFGEIVFISPCFKEEGRSYENFVNEIDTLSFDRDMRDVTLTIIAEDYPDDVITKLPFREMIKQELSKRPNWFKQVNII